MTRASSASNSTPTGKARRSRPSTTWSETICAVAHAPYSSRFLESAARFVGVQVLHTVAKEILFRQLLDVDDPGRDKNRSLPGTVRRGHFNQRLLHVPARALEAQAAARNVLALHKFFTTLGVADQPNVAHRDARILAPIDARSANF